MKPTKSLSDGPFLLLLLLATIGSVGFGVTFNPNYLFITLGVSIYFSEKL